MSEAYALRERAGKAGGGKGPLIQTNKSGTLSSVNDQVIFSMNEDKTIALAGNTIGRQPHNGGNGNGFETDGKMYTLTATDIHGVRYDTTHACDVVRESKDVVPTLKARMGTGGNNVPLTFGKVARPRGKDGLGERWDEVNVASTRNCQDVGDARAQEVVVSTMQVRRLTPIECERLQGFSDNYTKIPYRGKSADECPDSPRYKAIGNSWAVPVVRWIGKRIEAVLKGEIK